MKTMTRFWILPWLFSITLGHASDALVPVSPLTNRTLVEWTFKRPGEIEGWRPNAHLADVKVADGVLSARGEGPDPIFELQPLLDIPASAWQQIEIRLKADHDGVGEFFWSNTTQGRYGGFSQEKSTRFNVVGDGHWRVYQLLPFWQSEGKIVRLRFDPYAGATFAIESIRITELTMPATAQGAEFDFTRGLEGWQPAHGARLDASSKGLSFLNTDREGLLLGPPLSVAADRHTIVTVVMTAKQGRRATLFFASEKKPGLHSYSFPIRADGREHCYNLNLAPVAEWRGTIVALGLRPNDLVRESPAGNTPESEAPDAIVRSLSVASAPAGPPDLDLVSFALGDALPRAGVTTTLEAVLTNRGGQPATNLQAQLRLPPAFRVLASPTNTVIRSLAFGQEAAFTWTVLADSPARERAELLLIADGGAPILTQTVLEVTAPVAAAKSDYVPEPHPVRGPYEVGVYYFPGWQSAKRWDPLRHFPERKPVLGWYREGSPEVADWHIKWAVEHGITFFAYDWYWSQGTRQLEHALHDGYFQARYRALLKFCLLWANHNPPNTSSRADCVAVTRYWIENYFRRPEYLRIDGKPVVVIFSTDRLTSDLGSAKVKEAFGAMRAECEQAGLAGLFIMANIADAGQAQAAAAEGYDAVTGYNWPGLGLATDEQSGPYQTLLEGYRRNWLHILDQSPIPLALPISGGWDSRPWHGDNNLVRYDRTPELFRRHLADARRTIEERAPNRALRAVLIEAWNEWGEGSYIEPHREFGFGYLDAIREVFTDAPKSHVDLTPADVGLGPYEIR